MKDSTAGCWRENTIGVVSKDPEQCGLQIKNGLIDEEAFFHSKSCRGETLLSLALALLGLK